MRNGFFQSRSTSHALRFASDAARHEERLGAALRAANRPSQANGSLMRISPLGIFGAGRVIGAKPKLLPRGVFEKELVLAAIKRGDQIYTYKVNKATLKGGVLKLEYSAEGKGGGGTARFASTLVLAVPSKGVKSVEFIENGKKVATVDATK